MSPESTNGRTASADSTTKTAWRLEMTTREQFRPRSADVPELEFRRVVTPAPEFNKFLHDVVGSDYDWGGRGTWGQQEWTEYVSRPQLQTWVGYFSGAPAGYFELEDQPDGSVRVQTFGLLPAYIGRGLGGYFLTIAVERAWDAGANRVWLTTCSHDHKHALANYRARGFVVVGESTGPPNAKRPPWWS